MSKTEVKVSDVGPIVIDSLRIVYENWNSAAEREYKLELEEGEGSEGVTDEDGFIPDKNFPAGAGKITVNPINEIEETEYESNSGPLPVLELRDKKDGGEGPISTDDERQDLIDQLKAAFTALGYIEESSEEEDPYADFDEVLDKAIKQFQATNKDWDSQVLAKTGKVDPKTADSINRLLVGVWYDSYETPLELTEGFKVITVCEKAASEGVEI
ncbi:peptidoglycan-binding protein [Candidatus Bathyarchaeota archaeon]|nr:peptidoglycan-binding protein [Candidatus Bathyarchaeota archaeon]